MVMVEHRSIDEKLETVKVLLSEGADVNVKDRWDLTALEWATSGYEVEYLDEKVEREAILGKPKMRLSDDTKEIVRLLQGAKN